MNDRYLHLREHLAAAIGSGTYAPGRQLPTERELATKFNVSRSVARRALSELEAEGLIIRHVGRGTFVRPHPQAAVPNTAASRELISPAEYIEARLRFEPELAWMVATNASATDFARLREYIEKGDSAKNAEEYERWDAAFHQAIAAATHNKLAIAIYEAIHLVRQEHALWVTNIGGKMLSDRQIFQREHREILEALEQRNAHRACELMSLHVRNTRRRLLDL